MTAASAPAALQLLICEISDTFPFRFLRIYPKLYCYAAAIARGHNRLSSFHGYLVIFQF